MRPGENATAPRRDTAHFAAPLDESAARDDLEARLAAREYRASENDHGLQAPNRAHNLRTYFEPTGIRVVDRTAAGSPELLRLSLAELGRGDALEDLAPGTEVVVAENRVEVRRPGVVEWFVNGPDGLEQGFTLSEKPRGEGLLRLDLLLAGAKASPRGDALVFETATGRKLEYGKLVAFDARGERLAAAFTLAGADRIGIAVEDAGAEYPIVIDPLLTEAADSRLEVNRMNAQFGTSVASAGDVNGDGYSDVIVGSPSYDDGLPNEGAAFVFLGGASGILQPGGLGAIGELYGARSDSLLGYSVASAGDVNGDGYSDVIVGAQSYDNPQANEGAAFVFLGSSSGIVDGNPDTAQARLESDQAGSQFGGSVGSAGDVNGDGYADVIIGANFYSDGEPSEGSAFVFLGGANGVTGTSPANAHARLESDQSGAYFGTSVASAGDVNDDGYADVIVGAVLYSASLTYGGAAFVFHGGASGIADGNPSTASTQLAGEQAFAYFGVSVATAGDVNGDGYADVIVGAPGHCAGICNASEGGAFISLGGASGVADGIPSGAAHRFDVDLIGAQLGYSVASAGDVNGDGYSDVIVGAPFLPPASTSEGAAFVFLGSDSRTVFGNLTNVHAQLESDQVGDRSGSSVACAGDVNGDGYSDLIVGAPLYDNGQPNEGAAFVYHGGASGIADGNPNTASTQLEGEQDSAQLGFSVASAGDVNGDGYGDVIVGAPAYDNGQDAEGAAFVFHGGSAGILDAIPFSARAQLESNQSGAAFGYSVASAGDVDGDGFGDVIVGARLYDSGSLDEGAAFVFRGSPTGLVANGNPTNAHARFESDQASAFLGQSVASAGDLNGDGYGDVVVGAHGYDAGLSNEGAAFVFLGSASGMTGGGPGSAHARIESDQTDAQLGWSVASAGDVNGDGFADLIVGAYNYSRGQTSEGAAFVFTGSAFGISNGNPTSADSILESNLGGANLGFSVSSAGDVDGDGFADVIVGANLYSDVEPNEGAAFVFLGSASGLSGSSPSSAHAQLESDQGSAFLGTSVASAGDVNGDGYADVVVGAPSYDNLLSSEGAAFVFLGSSLGVADGEPATSHAQLESNQEGGLLGGSVASAGDVNGDGFSDLIVGAASFDSGQTNEGAAFVFQGGGGPDGRPVLIRQRRGDGSGSAVQPWGSAATGGAFVAELRANHPHGRGRVKAEFEACPSSAPFGDASCTIVQSPSWITVGGTTPDVSISQSLFGLASDALYRWRARILHTAPTGPIAANPLHGPWRRPGAQAVEADIRVPEPGFGAGIGAGLGLLVMWRRRRDANS